MNCQLHFTADFQRQPGEHVERIHHATVRAVLDRGNAVIGMTAIDLFEHRGDVVDGDKCRRGPKSLDRGQMRKAERRAKISDPHELDSAPRTGDHFSKDAPHGRFGEGARISLIDQFDEMFICGRRKQEFLRI